MNNYIWRGIDRSENGNYHMSLGWQYENWSGSFWGTYDTADDNFVTDFQSNWLEVDTTLAYTWERNDDSSIQLGYILYNFYDNFILTQATRKPLAMHAITKITATKLLLLFNLPAILLLAGALEIGSSVLA